MTVIRAATKGPREGSVESRLWGPQRKQAKTAPFSLLLLRAGALLQAESPCTLEPDDASTSAPTFQMTGRIGSVRGTAGFQLMVVNWLQQSWPQKCHPEVHHHYLVVTISLPCAGESGCTSSAGLSPRRQSKEALQWSREVNRWEKAQGWVCGLERNLRGSTRSVGAREQKCDPGVDV